MNRGKQRGKILLLSDEVVAVHQPSNEFVCSFGKGVFKGATLLLVMPRVMIVDPDDYSLYLFDVEGHQLGKFNIIVYCLLFIVLFAISCTKQKNLII